MYTHGSRLVCSPATNSERQMEHSSAAVSPRAMGSDAGVVLPCGNAGADASAVLGADATLSSAAGSGRTKEVVGMLITAA